MRAIGNVEIIDDIFRLLLGGSLIPNLYRCLAFAVEHNRLRLAKAILVKILLEQGDRTFEQIVHEVFPPVIVLGENYNNLRRVYLDKVTLEKTIPILSKRN